MNKILITLSIITIVLMVLLTLCKMISFKSITDREKPSPFECGFDPKGMPRLPFSIHFFLIAVIFIIFDVEIIIMMPMILSMKFSVMKLWFLSSCIFLIILIMGLMYEWKQSMLEWTL